MKYFVIILIYCYSIPLFANEGGNDFVKQALYKFSVLHAKNALNDSENKSYRNEYIIELNPDWIEERPSKKIIQQNYTTLRDKLISFNSRPDSLRLYVVVVNDYQMEVEHTIHISKDYTVGAQALRRLIALSESSFKEKFSSDLQKIQKGILEALKAKHVKKAALYFFGQITYIGKDKAQQHHYYDNLCLEGVLNSKQKKIREIIKSGMSEMYAHHAQVNNASAQVVEKSIVSIIHALQLVIDNTLNFQADASDELREGYRSGLWIKDGDTLVQYENKKLYKYINNTRVEYTSSKPPFLNKITTMLEKLETLTEGAELINHFEASVYNVTITDYRSWPFTKGADFFESPKFIAHSPDAENLISHYDQNMFMTQQLGSGGVVYIDNTTVNTTSPAYQLAVTLAHELFHAYDATKGWGDDRLVDGVSSRGEYRARYFENGIRKQLGVEPWPDKVFDPNGNPPKSPPKYVPEPTLSW
jgi:hypothetical protein